MKLQKEELSAVVNHIYAEIQKKNEVKLTKAEEKEIKDILDKRDKLYKESSILTEKANTLFMSFRKKCNIPVSTYFNSQQMLEQVTREVLKARSPKIPSLNDIRQQVVMKSLFSDEKELKTFIKELVDKY
jgi:hypothetical protein